MKHAMHGGVKKAYGMKKEVGSHVAGGYPKAGKSVHAHNDDPPCNSNHERSVGGALKHVGEYNP
jgi:hypothetical protein